MMGGRGTRAILIPCKTLGIVPYALLTNGSGISRNHFGLALAPSWAFRPKMLTTVILSASEGSRALGNEILRWRSG